jgi:hypothetical protein
MKKARKSPPRSQSKPLPFLGHVRAKVVNRTDPSVSGNYTGSKTKLAMRAAPPIFSATRGVPKSKSA